MKSFRAPNPSEATEVILLPHYIKSTEIERMFKK